MTISNDLVWSFIPSNPKIFEFPEIFFSFFGDNNETQHVTKITGIVVDLAELTKPQLCDAK